MTLGSKLRMFWHLPVWLQEMALSQYARGLDQIYYGKVFREASREISERRFQDLNEVREWQSDALKRVVQEAALHVPYYRQTIRHPSNVRSIEDLKELPILDKQRIRQQEASFLNEEFSRPTLHEERTSGTTGSALRIYWDSESLQRRWAAHEVRVHKTIGVDRLMPRGTVGGRPIVSGDRSKPPFWRHNRHWKQLYLSSYHISSRWTQAYIEAIKQSEVQWITGYGSAMAALAEVALEQDLSPLKMKVIVASGDTLQPGMRASIERFFQTRCYDHYGQSEGVCWMMECNYGRMHLCPEVGILEIVDTKGHACPPGQIGDIVATTLVNRAMPLIRYRIGDQAAWSPEQACPCASQFPIVQQIAGRIDDYLVTADHRIIGRLSTAFKLKASIHSAQVVQDKPGHGFLLVRPGQNYKSRDAESVRDEILDRIGRFSIEIVEVQYVPRMLSGKTKLVVRLSENPDLCAIYEKLLGRRRLRN